MAKIEVGTKVRKRLTVCVPGSHDDETSARWGRVIWVHPGGRFYLAEFNIGKRFTLRECFTE